MLQDEAELIQSYRYFLKDSIRKEIDFSQTPQSQQVEVPPIEKPYDRRQKRIELISADWEDIYDMKLATAMLRRKSRRDFTEESLSLTEVSFLLWATQGVRLYAGAYAFRRIPSAGCRHALETYLTVFNVDGLEEGVYRYLPLTHELLLEFKTPDLKEKMIKATFNQNFAGESAVTFIWSTIPYRMEWRYGLDSHKVIAMEAGHAGQNMYLAVEAIGCGTCAIGAYDQEYLDKILRLDGVDEFAIYLFPVGKVKD